ncbi:MULTISPECIES: hypothetical protein [unclassified Kitasatospora]|uniref:hypothetical protein n=1 Tax=unclassified Kitasatospora TaxID=2633591 RepID=UPI002E2F1DBD|nr:hypothetical protein [Kitasatospora sp. NBC_01246]
MRTRLLAATLTAFAAVSLAACSSGSGSDGSAAGSPTTPAAATASAPGTPAPGGTADPSGTGAPATPTAPGAPATGSPDGPAPGSTPPATPDAPDAPATSAPPKPAPPADAGLPAKPGSADAAKLVAALDAIDPAIVGGKPDEAVDRARNQCQAMYQFPKDRAKLVELVNQRFTAPDHPQGFGAEKAEKIIDALRATLCPPA